MAYNSRDLKVISIIQIVLSVIFFILGMVDGFEVRFLYSSSTFTPCWISALVLPVGIMGLILGSMSRPSLTLVNVLRSVSMACAAVSTVVVYHYLYALSILMTTKNALLVNYRTEDPYFLNKDAKIKFTDKENAMVAVSSLIIIFCIIEIILAVANASSSYTGGQGPPESQVNIGYRQLEAGQVPMQLQAQPTCIPAQPMVAIPVSAGPMYNVNQ